MLSLFVLLAMSLLQSCNDENKTSSSQENASPDFEWLVGSWVRTNDKNSNETFEYWRKNSSEEYIGLGCTIQKGDTIFKENLRIANINGEWNLEVSGVNENPTLFLVTRQTKNGFTSENEANEFPKKIEYFLDGETLNAIVSAGDTEIPFSFKKMGPN